MTRALQALLCAVTMIGCARTVEMPLEPVEMNRPANEPEGTSAASVDEVAVTDEEGAAGMSGESEVPAVPAEPAVEPPPAVEPALEDDSPCEGLAKLRARNGRITFNEDGSATVSVDLANVSDEDMFEYPGLSVRWEVLHSYASGDGGMSLFYGLLAGAHYEHTFEAPADVLQWGAGRMMIVHAEPFTLATLDSDHGCEPVAAEFSAVVP